MGKAHRLKSVICSDKKIGWRPHTTDKNVAGVRIRCLNVMSYLANSDHKVGFYTLSDNDDDFAAVVFSKAYTDQNIAEAERLKTAGVKIVFDICDNHFLLSVDVVRRLLRMIQLCDVCVVSTPSLKHVVETYCGPHINIEVIGDAVETSIPCDQESAIEKNWAKLQARGLKSFLRRNEQNGAVPLVWFGSHKGSVADSGMIHLERIIPLLEEICINQPLTITVISNSRKKYKKIFEGKKFPSYYLEWKASTFLQVLKQHSISIIPFNVNEFTRVKTNNRLALSVSQSLAVVADGIDSYKEFSHCAFIDNWSEGLTKYLADENLRETHINLANEIIEGRYSMPQIAERWRSLFTNLLVG